MTTTPNKVVTNPKPDYIIEFSIKGNKSDQLTINQEYDNLLKLLKDTGLESVSRLGNKGTGTLLIFVRAPQSRLYDEMIKERRSDWLHGVGSSPSIRDLAVDPITSEEKLRLVYSILTSSQSNSHAAPALSLVPNCAQFPRVLSIFPPHDPGFNRNWMKLWSSRTHILSIPSSELTMLKDHFGSTIALYFAFLQFYFSSLLIPTIFGLIFWFLNIKYSPLYSVGILLWSVIFVESWRIKERELAVEWGTDGVRTVEAIRPQFHGNKKEIDPITKELKPNFPWYQTLIRQLSNIPIVIVFAAALAVMLSIVYAIETLVGEVYVGPGKRLLALVPTILLSGLIPQFTKLWERVARRLTSYENHKHHSNYTNSLTLKVFALNFLLAYGALLLTSYVYIPFGGILVPHILTLLPKHESLEGLKALPSGTFSINSSKLHTQVIAFTLTGQIIGAFTENVVPILLRVLNREVANIQEKRRASIVEGGGKKTFGQDEEDEKAFLERIRFEATLPEYNGFADYAELAIQLGYLVMFSLIWPAAPFFSFINNFFELRSDGFKLASQSRRPIPSRDVSIGPWLEVLGFITWFGSLTNASLVYLYQPHYISTSTITPSPPLNSTISLLSNATSLTSATLSESCSTYTNLRLATLNPTLKDPHSYFNIKSTLFTALLVALASEHTYLLVKEGIRYLLVRAVWRGGKADTIIKVRELELKRGYLVDHHLEMEGKKNDSGSGSKVEKVEKRQVVVEGGIGVDAEGGEIFWKRGDLGREEINRRSKMD